MSGEKYLNHYVEVLTNTMTDAVIRNISLQANARVTEEVVTELSKEIQILRNELENLKNNVVTDLNTKLSDYNRMKTEYDNFSNKVNHVDTFRSELVKEREEHKKTRDSYENKITELNSQIEYLQLTPAKRKKIDDEKNKPVETEIISTLPIDESIKDGGSF